MRTVTMIPLLLAVALAVLLGLGARRIRLPPQVGMLVGGMLVAAVHGPLAPTAQETSSDFRLAILALVLLRAGLGLSGQDLRAGGMLGLKLGVLPVLSECAVVAAAAHLLLHIPISSAVVLGALVAAISPAIVIPGVLGMLSRVKGQHRRIPAALLAGAPLDNIVALLIMGVALDLGIGNEVTVGGAGFSLAVSVVGGIALGGAVGGLVALALRQPRAVKHPLTPFSLWLLACLMVFLGQRVNVSLVLAVITFGFLARRFSAAGLTAVNAHLATFFGHLEYALFGLIGAAVSIQSVGEVGLFAVALIVVGQVARGTGALTATAGSQLRPGERLACALSYVPKATVQAAFASVALEHGLEGGQMIVTTAVLAVMITAPIGMVTLNRTATRLLGIEAKSG